MTALAVERRAVSSLLACLLCLSAGCVSVMQTTTYRPMEIRVEVPEHQRNQEISMWLLDRDAAADVSHELGHGEFPAHVLDGQPVSSSRGMARLSAWTEELQAKGSNVRRPFGLHRGGPVRAQQRVIAVLKAGEGRELRVLEVLDGQVATQYRVRMSEGRGGAGGVAVRLDPPSVRITTSREGDAVTWKLD